MDWAEAHRICLRVARHYASDSTEAEDVAQDAMVRAWRRRSSLRRGRRLREWLAAIARNEAFRHRSRRRPEPVATRETDVGAEDERMLTAGERADVAAALAQLRKSDRLLLELRYAEDLTQAAIARLLQLPEGTVKVRLHRARARFRDVYDSA
jgi:RNA polymerase sigma-70 factor, ECF subfamily